MRQTVRSACRTAWVPALAGLVMSVGVTQASAKPKAYADPTGSCQGRSPCYRTIQAAIHDSTPGTVVLALPGTYREHVSLSKSLILRGRNATIDGGGSGTVLALSTTGATVKGLSLTDGDVGIALRGASGNRLAGLGISRMRRGLFFSGEAKDNVVVDTDVGRAREFAVDVGDQNDSGNRFRRLRLHDSAKGFNAYRGSDGLLLTESSIRRISPGPGVVIGWSDGWVVSDNQIVGNATGVLTDTVDSGSIIHNYIARNKRTGIEEAGLISTVSTRENRIERNGLSGIALCIAARGNQVRRNMVSGNARYAVEICAHPSPRYFNTGNTVSDNYLFGVGDLGDALDDQGSNTWSGNYYSANFPWVAPFSIPGAAAASDPSPLTKADLPQPRRRADCGDHKWWLLTDGSAPFATQRACLAFAKAINTDTRNCSDFATQRDAQIYFLEHGGPERDPNHLDGDHNGIACQGNPCPCYDGTTLPPPAAVRAADAVWARPHPSTGR